MRSRTSCFNGAFSRSLLRRFWPLWLIWLAALLLIGLGTPATVLPESYVREEIYLRELTRTLLEDGTVLAKLSIAAGPIMAMAMLGYLYSPRSCNMVCALPLKRETVYCTAVLTGLLPMLLFDVLTAALLWLRWHSLVPGGYFARWLMAVAAANTGFYGLACFCGTLTGSTVVLPLVYVALGFTASVVENTARNLLGALVYGYTWDKLRFTWLAPLPLVLDEVRVVDLSRSPVMDSAQGWRYEIRNLGYLGALAAVGLVLAALGVLLIKKRRMENAGDIVAVPVLKPVFRVCMAVGCGLVLATAGSDGYFDALLGGRTLALVIFALLILGAALGWFLAEMLIKKTLRVFRHGWLQLGLVCLCLLVPFVLAELDVTGYETRVPEPAEVRSVNLGQVDMELYDPESIAAFCDFHRRIVDHWDQAGAFHSPRCTYLPLVYTMQDGSRLSRLYRIPNNERSQADPDSDIAAYERLLNQPEAILARVGVSKEYTAGNILHAELALYTAFMQNSGWRSESITLTPEQAASLYAEGILPDAREGNIGRWFAWEREESQAVITNISIVIDLKSPHELETSEDGDLYMRYDPAEHLNLSVLTESAHTLQWLKENLGLEALSRLELQNQ